jgi:hypothetical protein
VVEAIAWFTHFLGNQVLIVIDLNRAVLAFKFKRC